MSHKEGGCVKNKWPYAKQFRWVHAEYLWIVILDSKKSKEIDLYSDYTENKLQMLTFSAITSVCISLQLV